jgi:chromosome segregation ATPase
VGSQLRLPDGSLRESLSSLRVVEFAGEAAVLSVTHDNDAVAARAEARSLREQLQRMEREIARHNEREQRLISQIGGLCDQAGLLKSDVMRVKSLQHELNAEMEGLRQVAERFRGEALAESASAPSVEAVPSESPKTAPASAEPLTAPIAARLSAFEDRLQLHVAALRAHTASLRSNAG